MKINEALKALRIDLDLTQKQMIKWRKDKIESLLMIYLKS